DYRPGCSPGRHRHRPFERRQQGDSQKERDRHGSCFPDFRDARRPARYTDALGDCRLARFHGVGAALAMANALSHFDEHGASRMVDTSGKPETLREARASGRVRMAAASLALIRDKGHAKGDVLEVARLAGIMAAKHTGDLIPLCHPLPITSAAVDFSFPADDLLRIEATVRVFGRTGVEMEALTAVSVAPLPVYDMCKAVARVMTIYVRR